MFCMTRQLALKRNYAEYICAYVYEYTQVYLPPQLCYHYHHYKSKAAGVALPNPTYDP